VESAVFVVVVAVVVVVVEVLVPPVAAVVVVVHIEFEAAVAAAAAEVVVAAVAVHTGNHWVVLGPLERQSFASAAFEELVPCLDLVEAVTLAVEEEQIA